MQNLCFENIRDAVFNTTSHFVEAVEPARPGHYVALTGTAYDVSEPTDDGQTACLVPGPVSAMGPTTFGPGTLALVTFEDGYRRLLLVEDDGAPFAAFTSAPLR
jgi:hypothetical protein